MGQKGRFLGPKMLNFLRAEPKTGSKIGLKSGSGGSKIGSPGGQKGRFLGSKVLNFLRAEPKRGSERSAYKNGAWYGLHNFS